MNETEYMALFKQLDEFKDTPKHHISGLVDTIDSLPLVLRSMIYYMRVNKKSPNSFLQDYNYSSTPMLNVVDNLDNFESDYKKSVLKSQVFALSYVKSKLLKKKCEIGWEVVKLLSFLRFTSVSRTVLEACYFHLKPCQWTVKKKLTSIK